MFRRLLGRYCKHAHLFSVGNFAVGNLSVNLQHDQEIKLHRRFIVNIESLQEDIVDETVPSMGNEQLTFEWWFKF